MKVIVYSAKDFEQAFLAAAAEAAGHEFYYEAAALGVSTARAASGFDAVVVFAGDDVSGPVIEQLAAQGEKYIAVRAAGYDNVDLERAHSLHIRVANVPAYSPYAIAEHSLALMLALNRKLIVADRQVHAYDFTVGKLVGFDLHGKTVGIIGTGNIGRIVARILNGFGCRILGYDISEDASLRAETGLEYCSLSQLCRQSDIITIHTNLNPGTRHLINAALIDKFKPGAILINTSRGAIVRTEDVLAGLRRGQIAAYGADVYEGEKGIFFYDRSGARPEDAVLDELLSMPNVLLTPHQAFATREALGNIAETTCQNLSCWERGRQSPNEL